LTGRGQSRPFAHAHLMPEKADYSFAGQIVSIPTKPILPKTFIS